MTEHIILRSGDVPLQFDGELLAEVSTRVRSGQERNRWYEIDLYRTSRGKFVLMVAFRTRWQGEGDTVRVVQCDTPVAVRAALHDFDPLRDVTGYPPGDAYTDKQARLESMLRRDWEAGVRELFAEVENAAEFAERID